MKGGKLVSATFLLFLLSSLSSESIGGERPALYSLNSSHVKQQNWTENSLTLKPSVSFPQTGTHPLQKSVFKAVVLSLVMPGMGELYSGEFGSGKYFLAAEAGLWATFASFELYGHWLQNDARKYAALHCGALIEGKDNQFFVNIGNFNNVYDYNEKKLRDRDLGSVYDPTGTFYWSWDSEQARQRFRDLRVKSDNVLNNVRFVAAVIVVNHVASAINAARLVSRKNEQAREAGWRIESNLLGRLPNVEGVMLTFRKSF